jgi:hypothetical protein
MANILKTEKKVAVISMLAEERRVHAICGSIRSPAR